MGNESNRVSLVTMFTLLVTAVFLVGAPKPSMGWGRDGHYATCTLAEMLFSEATRNAVQDLLPEYAEGRLASLCSWADDVRNDYSWSSALHFVNPEEFKCNYNYERDCWDSDGLKNRCASGAIYNYTSQLTAFSSSSSQYNLTEALLFLSHFVGDIHQPLHVGFASDRGGNTIKVYWYNESVNLHHVWDTSIIVTSEERFYNSSLDDLVDDIGQKITEGYWKNETADWERCSRDDLACPDTYAAESIKAACKWAYRNATPGSYLADEYFLTRMPIVETRLAQGGVRLAGILNRIFAEGRVHNMALVDA